MWHVSSRSGVATLRTAIYTCYLHAYPFNGPLSGTTQVSRYQKGRASLDLLKQETVSGSGISWAVCKSALRSRQITSQHPTTSLADCKENNEWVLNKADEKRELLDTARARKPAYYGHTRRKQGSCLENEIMLGRMPCARRRGRPRTAWMDNIKNVDRTVRGRVNQNDRGQR